VSSATRPGPFGVQLVLSGVEGRLVLSGVEGRLVLSGAEGVARRRFPKPPIGNRRAGMNFHAVKPLAPPNKHLT
jgi:hypothetical protein